MRLRRRSDEEYPGLMAARPRLQRMLCFLKHYGLSAAAREVEKETRVFFDVAHMEQMMMSGRWDEVERYLEGFLQHVPDADRSHQCSALLINARVFKILAKVAAGGPEGAEVAAMFQNPSDRVLQDPRGADFYELINGLGKRTRESIELWRQVQLGAVGSALDVVAKCPELKGKLQLPPHSPYPWDVLPLIGVRGSRGRHKKPADRMPADVLARAFLRKRLLWIQETDNSGFPSNAYSQSVALNKKAEQISPQPPIPRADKGECGNH